MTDEEVLKLAQGCGLPYAYLGERYCTDAGMPLDSICSTDVRFEQLQAFATAVETRTLERAAEICEKDMEPHCEGYGHNCAAAIREKKNG